MDFPQNQSPFSYYNCSPHPPPLLLPHLPPLLPLPPPPPLPISAAAPASGAAATTGTTWIQREDPTFKVTAPETMGTAWTQREDQMLEAVPAAAHIPVGVPNGWVQVAGRAPEDSRLLTQEAALAEEYRRLLLQHCMSNPQPRTWIVPNSARLDPPASLAVGAAPRNIHRRYNAPQEAQPHAGRNQPPGRSWSEEEHKLFLRGLETYGRGHWTAISRNVVLTRTPAQVASHAQKFFLRQETKQKKRSRRNSIHDITSYA